MDDLITRQEDGGGSPIPRRRPRAQPELSEQVLGQESALSHSTLQELWGTWVQAWERGPKFKSTISSAVLCSVEATQQAARRKEGRFAEGPLIEDKTGLENTSSSVGVRQSLGQHYHGLDTSPFCVTLSSSPRRPGVSAVSRSGHDPRSEIPSCPSSQPPSSSQRKDQQWIH